MVADSDSDDHRPGRGARLQLDNIKKRVQKGRLQKTEAIALSVGRVIDRFKMAKRFDCVIEPGSFDYWRREDSIRKEAILDGMYVDRVRAHTFLCMLAYYVQWHMEQDLASLRHEDAQASAVSDWPWSALIPFS